MNGLKQKRPNDFRIKHNIAICAYALSGKTRTSDFQSKLAQLESERKETKNSIFTLKYNQAVILFHQQNFKKSLDILNKLKGKWFHIVFSNVHIPIQQMYTDVYRCAQIYIDEQRST